MGHFFLHSGVWSHPLVFDLSDRECNLWFQSIAYCSRNGKRAFFPDHARREITFRYTKHHVAKLVDRGLWVPGEEGGVAGHWVPQTAPSGEPRLYKFSPDKNKNRKSRARPGARRKAPNSGIPSKRPKIRAATRREVLDRYNYQCRWCWSRKNLHIDHILPLSRGGAHESWNMQVLCKPCNLKKHARTEAEARRLLGVC